MSGRHGPRLERDGIAVDRRDGSSGGQRPRIIGPGDSYIRTQRDSVTTVRSEISEDSVVSRVIEID